jgi:hypothetical protein
VVPVRSAAIDRQLMSYLHELSLVVEDVIVVDGSEEEVFHAHRLHLPPTIRHEPPSQRTVMGKVGGVMTGVQLARHEVVVIADDDVRWDPSLLERALVGLGDADVARPQNVFVPSPWHARWDTGRILLNRAISGDWPGTLLVRRSALRDGYAGDALFENLELVRTVLAAGGRERVLFDVVVPRCPPSVGRFWEQRVRQAYDEWARPWRLALQLTWLPLAVRRPRRAAGLAVAAVAMAEVGRRRAGGTAHWGPTAPLWVLPWLAERAVTSWLAALARLRGGARYRDQRLPVAAHSRRALRARSARRPSVPVGRPAREGRAAPVFGSEAPPGIPGEANASSARRADRYRPRLSRRRTSVSGSSGGVEDST